MSEPFDASGLISKKGWFDADYDEHVWIPCPPVFPPGVDTEIYALGVARIWLDRVPPRDRKPGDLGLLAAQLAEIHDSTYGKVLCCHAFIHLPHPGRQLPLVVYAGVWESDGGRDGQLRMLCRADDPQAAEPPAVEEFATDRLGTGLRVLRHCRSEDGELYAGLSYAFRSEELETDLVLSAVSADPGRLQDATGDIENLARSMMIISQEELT